MALIRLRLLGDINSVSRGKPSTLAPKYVAVISAENLSPLIKYRRQKGKHPIRIESDSTIRVDAEVQRGLTDTGNLRQEDKKIDEIRDALLGAKNAALMVFLGSLIWNIRENGIDVFKKLRVSEEGHPPEYELAINTPSVYLTDSAHRHFGIAEAYKEYTRNPQNYPRFSKDFEFVVEIYNLDRSGERLLFNELNSKQKKITAAKQQQMDTTSDIGVLKDRIATIDLEQNRLLHQNIEVNANTNDRHTLMTMSVLTASIREMFDASILVDIKKDEELRDELAQYYCDFLYKLQETIRTNVTIGTQELEISPFSNLYTEIISPAENDAAELDDDAAEQVLETARNRARKKNADIRNEEKIHSNSFIRALFWLGGKVRRMHNWKDVIDQIQAKLIAGANGRYFQKSNPKLTSTNERGIAIGVIKDDGTLNIQVQSHVINEIKKLLLEELDLQFDPKLFYKEHEHGASHELFEKEVAKIAILSRKRENRLEFQLDFITGDQAPVDKSALLMKVSTDLPKDIWKEVERRGQKRLIPHEVAKVFGWEHPVYGKGLVKYTATYVIDCGPFTANFDKSFLLKLEPIALDISGANAQKEFNLRCQPSVI